MLSSINLNDKSYEDLIAEALRQIPLYSEEWTNFNRSDPGITTLQNISAFNALQQSYINEMTDEIRRALLRLLRLQASESRAATVLVESHCKEPVTLLQSHKLKAGNLCFEVPETTTVQPWGLRAVYTGREGSYRDITYLLDREAHTSVPVFGNSPEPGMSLLFILGGKPEPGRELVLYIAAESGFPRNPFPEANGPVFAELRWELFTANGWQAVEARDETHGMVVSGEVVLSLPVKGAEPCEYEQEAAAGFAVRCVLERALFDVPPRLSSVSANLLRLVQRQTKVLSVPLNGGSSVELQTDMADYGNIFVFCREEKGGPYRAYRQYTGWGESRGRYYTATVLSPGRVRLEFDKKRFGYAPGRGWGAIRAVCYDDEMVHHRDLGPVYGYVDQIVDIDLTKNILPDSFSVLAETRDKDGELVYSVVSPGLTQPDVLGYEVLAQDGKLRIYNPGLGEDCRLYLCDLAVTEGESGNIREGNRFTPMHETPAEIPELFINPAPGRGGSTRETAEQLRRRFVREMRRPTSAVMASDYEEIAKSTPGLCIHKVRAVRDAEHNRVRIAVKPYTVERFSQLSPLYLEKIRAHLELRRLVTTRIELLQPRYVPIDVKATIYVKSYYADARREIEELLGRELDYISSSHGFGETVYFNELFRKLEGLPCVESVFELLLIPRGRGAAISGADIQLGDDCLCYPGRMNLEINSK